jgi:hypothetical protein
MPIALSALRNIYATAVTGNKLRQNAPFATQRVSASVPPLPRGKVAPSTELVAGRPLPSPVEGRAGEGATPFAEGLSAALIPTPPAGSERRVNPDAGPLPISSYSYSYSYSQLFPEVPPCRRSTPHLKPLPQIRSVLSVLSVVKHLASGARICVIKPCPGRSHYRICQ